MLLIFSLLSVLFKLESEFLGDSFFWALLIIILSELKKLLLKKLLCLFYLFSDSSFVNFLLEKMFPYLGGDSAPLVLALLKFFSVLYFNSFGLLELKFVE